MPFIPTSVLQRNKASSLPITANLQGWYDASDTATLTITSNKVSQWNDKSGNGFDLTQGTAGVRPLYDSSPRRINGVIIPEWTAAGEFMTSSLPASSRSSTTFATGILDNLSAARTLWGDTGGGGNELRIQTSALIATLKSTVSALSSGPNLYPSPLGYPFVLVQRLTPTTVEHNIVGTYVRNAEATTFTAARTFRLGIDQSATVLWDGVIAEVIRYNAELSDNEVFQVMDYLTAKWLRP